VAPCGVCIASLLPSLLLLLPASGLLPLLLGTFGSASSAAAEECNACTGRAMAVGSWSDGGGAASGNLLQAALASFPELTLALQGGVQAAVGPAVPWSTCRAIHFKHERLAVLQ
jgi:hypothetical protein